MKAIVHIGMMKTGSTSIQSWLRINRVALAEFGAHTLHGKVRPNAAMSQAIFQTAVHEMGVDEEAAWIGRKESFKSDVTTHEDCKTLTGELEKLSGNPGVFLFCCDQIYKCSEILMFAVDKYFSRFFDNITYVVYIRNAPDFFASLYSEQIQNNLSHECGTHEFSKFLEKCENDLAPFGLDTSFANLLDWQRAVGNRLNVRLLEPEWLVKGDLIEDFASLSGVATLEKPPRMNESIAAEYIEYVRFLNQEFRNDLPVDIRRKVIKILKHASSGRLKLSASDAQAESIRDIRREVEERIKNEFFPDRPFLFSQKSYGHGVAPVPLTIRRKAEIDLEVEEKMAPEVWPPQDIVCAAGKNDFPSILVRVKKFDRDGMNGRFLALLDRQEGAEQCHVYICLPGMTHFTTAGQMEISRGSGDDFEGRFVYCRNYIDNPAAVPIDPVQLDQLNGAVYRTNMFHGLFSSFLDALPQEWGHNFIGHAAPQFPQGLINGYILQCPDDHAGALGFGHLIQPAAPNRKFLKIADLERLATLLDSMNIDSMNIDSMNIDSMNIEDGIRVEANSGRLREISQFRTSLGGRRPKAVVEDADGLWLAKFNRSVDGFSFARIEHAMLKLAKSCGIRCATSRVETIGGREILLVKRFDREKSDRGYTRLRMISGYTALRTGRDRGRWIKSWGYAPLADELGRISARPEDEMKELYRRMIFNALISNKGDDPGNHSIISKHAGWELSPAYDMRPYARHESVGARELSMNCGIEGRKATQRNLLSECGRFHLIEEEAVTIIDAMEERVRNSWYRIARDAGVSETDCSRFSPAFAYPGFRREGAS